METKEKQEGLIRNIILKLFCKHQYEEIYKVERKDKFGNTVEIAAARECKVCGRSKKIVI
jgi:hypothetical protein